MNHRVVITGMGAVSPLGNDVSATWEALLAGKSGIGPITRFDVSAYPTRIAGELRGFDPAEHLQRKEVRRNDPFVWYSLAAASEAMRHAALDPATIDTSRFGTFIGSGIGGITTWEDQHKILLERGPGRVSPFFVPMMITNMAAGAVSIRFNARGPSVCTVSACSSGAHAIGEAFRTIQKGDADVMLAGGSEASVTPISMAGFCSLKALSSRNEEPERASRPFDRNRDGFVLSEGAAIILLERLDHATSRGATPLCEIAGYGSTSDAHHITAPSPEGEGAARAMHAAIKDAGVRPRDVDYINAHGTSTQLNDRFETMAIRRVLGDHADSCLVSSTKSMTGHLLGAAGSLECVITALSIRNGIAPPTINLTDPDPDCDLDYVPHEPRRAAIRIALSNSLGFGGHNVTLALRAFE